MSDSPLAGCSPAATGLPAGAKPHSIITIPARRFSCLSIPRARISEQSIPTDVIWARAGMQANTRRIETAYTCLMGFILSSLNLTHLLTVPRRRALWDGVGDLRLLELFLLILHTISQV